MYLSESEAVANAYSYRAFLFKNLIQILNKPTYVFFLLC